MVPKLVPRIKSPKFFYFTSHFVFYWKEFIPFTEEIPNLISIFISYDTVDSESILIVPTSQIAGIFAFFFRFMINCFLSSK